MNILVCIKRVPATAGKITLTADEQAIDTRYLGFTVSPHEECAVEEAVRIVEAHGGSSTVLTLGPEEATDQLREAMAVGIDRAILLQTDGGEWGAVATAAAIVDAIRAREAVDGPVRPHPARQRGGRHRRLPGRRPGRGGPRPARRLRRQGARGPRRHGECPARGARWRLGGLRDPAPRGRDRQGRASTCRAIRRSRVGSVLGRRRSRPSRSIRRPPRRLGSACACRSRRRVPSRSWARVRKLHRASSRCCGALG